ncbi:MAG TPA: hypothetical protein VFQ91_16315 [Bryobacteraceae bacterium]|nr:hypothetical protein [Bryobacteraceae bacterium]
MVLLGAAGAVAAHAQTGRVIQRIELRAASTKPGGGVDQITITSAGEISLLSASGRRATGKAPAGTATALWQLMKNEGFDNWDKEYKSDTSDYVGKVLTVDFIGGDRTEIVLNRSEFPEFAHVVGAIKFLLALAMPEMATNRFFERL